MEVVYNGEDPRHVIDRLQRAMKAMAIGMRPDAEGDPQSQVLAEMAGILADDPHADVAPLLDALEGDSPDEDDSDAALERIKALAAMVPDEPEDEDDLPREPDVQPEPRGRTDEDELLAQGGVVRAPVFLAQGIDEAASTVRQHVISVAEELDRAKRGEMGVYTKQDQIAVAQTVEKLLEGPLLRDRDRADLHERIRRHLGQ